MKRQVGGKRGERNRRYQAIRPRRIVDGNLRKPFPIIGGMAREEACPSKQLSQNPSEDLRIRLSNSPVGYQDEVEALRHLRAMEAEVLPDPPLDAAADHRPSDPPAHSEAEAPPLIGPLADKEAHPPQGELFSAPEDLAELPGAVNPISLGESVSHPGLDPSYFYLYRQALPPLRPSPLKDPPPLRCPHPPAEPMGPFPFHAARLVGPLHDTLPSHPSGRRSLLSLQPWDVNGHCRLRRPWNEKKGL